MWSPASAAATSDAKLAVNGTPTAASWTRSRLLPPAGTVESRSTGELHSGSRRHSAPLNPLWGSRRILTTGSVTTKDPVFYKDEFKNECLTKSFSYIKKACRAQFFSKKNRAHVA